MNLLKEREAFEAIAENIRLLRGAKFKDGEYVALSLFDESSKELAAQLNYGWSMWLSAKAQAAQEWINVDDRLPPVDETVLVCWDYAPDIEPEKEYTTIDENLDEYWPNCQDEPPTHWMPLPKVVKAQEPVND